jgi:flagellar protein FliJ
MFKFPLQRILDLKAKREEEVARKLAAAQAQADAKRQVRDSLAAAHEDGRAQIAGNPGDSRTVGEIQSLAFVLARLEQHIASADSDTAAAEAAVQKVHGELTVALQERRVLDRLRERRLEAHTAAASQKDLQTMDAVALARFAQRSAGEDGGTERTS